MSYPVSINVNGRLCVVVGGGTVALRKVQGLLSCGARVKVISPAVVKPLGEAAEAGKILWEKKLFEETDLSGASLAFAATADLGVNQAVREAAAKEKILVNMATEPDGGDFSLPALYRNGEVSVAVSTGGAAPAYAARLRDIIAVNMPKSLGKTAMFLRKLRSVTDPATPAETWRKFMVSGTVDDLSKIDVQVLQTRLDEFFGPGTWEKMNGGSVKAP